MNQTQHFIDTEGDAWFERNHRRLGERDPVTEAIETCRITPKSVLEIGCANGWRLKKLRHNYPGCECFGIDPSKHAVWDAKDDHVRRAWADRIPFLGDAFDMVIYGFCLYVTDPVDWFTIVAEGDRVLKDRGHLIIHDFAPATSPHARKYEHADGVLAYHVNFAGLWAMHPWYRLVKWCGDYAEVVAVMQKRRDAIPVLP